VPPIAPDDAGALTAVRSTRLLQDVAPEILAELAAEVEFMRLEVGDRLFKEGSGAGALYLLAEGLLHATEPDLMDGPKRMRIIASGEAVDGLQELGGANTWAVIAQEPSLVAVIPDAVVDRMSASYPAFKTVLERMHRRQSLTSLRRIFGPVDEGLLNDLERLGDWMHVGRGEVIFEPAARADSVLFIIRGRVAALNVAENGEERLESYRSRGETVGESGFLTGRPRAYRARATRDSILVRYSSSAFEDLIAAHPRVMRYLTRAVSVRASAPLRTARNSTISSIALVPASPRSPMRAVADRVAAVLDANASVLQLDAARVDALGGAAGLAQATAGSALETRLLELLERWEAEHRFVVYVADPEPSAWSRRCVRHADRLVLVADPRELHTPPRVEQDVVASSVRQGESRAVLVLAHADGTRPPANTRYWLDARPYVSEHHHVRMSEPGDFSRLARILSGRAIGLVLGGGGARGFAHIGLLRALEEAGIPVDMVGGTSMGAFIGGQFAMGRTLAEITRVSRKVFLEIRPHRGFTLPLLALVGRDRIEEAGRAAYGDVDIEDLWRSYFCVSANLTTADIVVHRRGPLRHGATASANLPGVSVPVLHDRHLLVDGGVLNNLPTDVMRRAGAGVVIASIVSAQVGSLFTCDRVPGTWEMLRGHLTGRQTAAFPTLIEVMMRSTVLYSASRERASAQDADLAIRPAVAGFGLLAFERIEEIVAAGYDAGMQVLPGWKAQAGTALA
jgi:predicted acylesterase/phospholipase RssA/CRP-like cAMP-binding protein